MAKLAEALRKLIENPDDLSTLPQLIAKVEEIENSEEQYQTRIANLQEINKSYLAQIPISGELPKDEPEDVDATIEDAKEHIIRTLGGQR